MKIDVYGVGNALVDLQVQLSDEILARTGFEKGIMTLVDDDQQRRLLDEISQLPRNQCAGGSAANTIVGIADLGGTVAYCGKVSQDAMGEFFLADMRGLGVSVDVAAAAEGPTGTCAVLITPDAQRTMLTNLGVSATLTPEDIDEQQLRQADYVYIEGYLLTGETTRAAAYRAMELAQQHGVKVALTASDPFLVNMIRDEIWQLIEGPVDMFFCNEEEALSLTNSDNPADSVQAIHQHVPNVAITLGANGSIIMHQDEVITVGGVEVEAVDTTGAGDMYAAGLLYGVTNGMDWKQAGRLASHCAARVVSQLGARLEEKMSPEEIEAL
jgi:sugar/nucleoside kinase (ribokinase family)